MNSTVEPIFNEKVAEKWNLWVREQCTVCTDWLKRMRKVKLCVPKKKKKEKRQTPNADAQSKRSLSLMPTNGRFFSPFLFLLLWNRVSIRCQVIGQGADWIKFIRWFSLVPRQFEIKCPFGLGSISRLHFVLRFFLFFFFCQLQQGTVATVMNSSRTFLTFSSLYLFIYFGLAAVGNSGYCYEQ